MSYATDEGYGQDVTTAEGLADLVVAALVGKTEAGVRVFGYRDWPTKPDEFPIILVGLPDEEKTSQGRGSIGFTVVAPVPVHAQVRADGAPLDKGANVVREALARIRRQIERAVIGDPDITAVIQHMPFVRSKLDQAANGEQHMGEVAVLFGMEFYQDALAFAPPVLTDLVGATITADLIGPFDRTGTYPDPAFPDSVRPAPRTSGPDGRAEGGADIDLN